jgi:hypothetical protein
VKATTVGFGPAGLLLALISGCDERYSAFAELQLQQGLLAAGRVRPEVVADHVRVIYEARLGDDDTSFDYSALCPVVDCTYSRAATRAVIERIWSGDDRATIGELSRQTVERDGFSTTNLMLDIPSATASDEWVIATAHYDAWFGAANDNATGVAVTLEAAVALEGLALDRNVRLLLTDGEELGIVGGIRYVQEFGTRGVVMALNADMIAHRGERGGLLTREPERLEYIVQGNEQSAGEAFQLADLGRRLPEPLEMRPVIYPGDGLSVLGFAVGSVLSDHAPFWAAGTKALFPFPAGDKPAWYHTEEDTPDRVDPDRLARMARLWAGALAAFATEAR